MEINAEADSDDTVHGNKNEKFLKMQKFRQTFNAARRFANVRSNNGNIPHLFSLTEES